MISRFSTATDPFALEPEARERLALRVDGAIRWARRGPGPAVAAVTVPLPSELDLSAAVLAARRPDDHYFCFEQPDRDGFVLAGPGSGHPARGPRGGAICPGGRLRARELGRRTLADDAARDGARPTAAGPVFVGGFAFAAAGGSTPEWASLPPASLVLPQVTLSRHRGQARLTVCAVLQPDDDADAILEGLESRLAELAPASMPLLDPDPVERTRLASAAPPSHYEHAVERAVERIRRGELDKIVLAREVRAHAARPHDPGAVLGALREAFPACYCWCVGTPEAAFVGASPELLVRRDGARVQTVALAGTTRRSADPSVTTISASSCWGVPRIARSRGSSPAGFSAPSIRSASGSRLPPSRCW